MADPQLNILLIENDNLDRQRIQAMVAEEGRGEFRLLVADRVGEALALLDHEHVDVILQGLRFPDADGLDAMSRVQAHAAGIPIVVLSGTEDESLAVRAVSQGAQDFLVKQQLTGALLVRSLRYALERRRAEEHLYHLAHHDVLTGLPNRKLFHERLSRALAVARRHQKLVALMLFDLNGFKKVNDLHGHTVGDELLKQVARRLETCLRTTDCAARLGGDEFVLYAADLADNGHAAKVAEKVLSSLAVPHVINGQQLTSMASLGVAMYPADGEDIESLIKRADSAMYRAKAQPGAGNRYCFYERGYDANAIARVELEDELRQALARQEFSVDYQPQFDLRSGRVIGVEALLRWRRGDRVVMPGEFLPALEESGLVTDVGDWVLHAACRQAVAWKRRGLPPVRIGVNISRRQFRDPLLVDRVAHALVESALDPEWLALEISEASLREDEDFALSRLWQLHVLGVHVALGNFRAQAITLRDLQRFPIHAIKLDRSIVRAMAENPDDADMVRAMISVAHVFKIKGMAEGVETEAEAEMLRNHTWDDAQGYAFGGPLSADGVADLLSREPSRTLH